jgi:hypothetical protein
MSFSIELGMLAAVRDCVVRDARRGDTYVERRDRRENIGAKQKRAPNLPWTFLILTHVCYFLPTHFCEIGGGW